MEIINENTTRKIDSLGRIGVPKGIRNRLQLNVNQEMDFFTMQDDFGRNYVLFSPAVEMTEENKYAQAVAFIEALGLEVPADFKMKVE